MSRVDTACPHCDLIINEFEYDLGFSKSCPRCNYTLSNLPKSPIEQAFYWNISTLFLFPLVYIFPFLSFNLQGISSTMHFGQSIRGLIENGFMPIAIIFSISLLCLPIILLLLSSYIHWQAYRSIKGKSIFNHANITILKILKEIKPWLMVDVFLIGVLVSLVKVMSLATISFGISFWIFIIFTICFTKALISIDFNWLWSITVKKKQEFNVELGEQKTAANLGLKICHTCGNLELITTHKCSRCHDKVHLRIPHSLQKTIAFLIVAIILYIPANIFPMMNTFFINSTEPSTIISGIVLLISLKSYLVAIVIFIASVMVPIAKMFSLAWLCYIVKWKKINIDPSMKIYRITEFIGRWSMIDIFVVSLLTALIHLNGFMVVYPGTASVSFTIVVIITMVAAHSFDPRLLWDFRENNLSVNSNN